MGVFYETIPEKTIKWCLEQKMFFVATAPLSGKGHVNVSPKGAEPGQFGIPDETTFWYHDFTGSGNETLSHLYESGNARITIMFCAVEPGSAPQIIRFWGTGRALECGTQEFDNFVEKHNIETGFGTRSIILVDIHQVGSSCGFSVPFYEFKEFRPVLKNYWKNKERRLNEGKTQDSMERYWAYKNAWSMDGLPGMKQGLITAKAEAIAPSEKMVGSFASNKGKMRQGYDLQDLILVSLIAFLLGIILICYGPQLKSQFSREVTRLSATIASQRTS